MSRMRSKLRFIALPCVFGLGLAAVAQAQSPKLGLVQRPGERFERSIEVGKLSVRYRDRLAEARKLDAAPQNNVLERNDIDAAQLRHGVDALDERIEKARRSANDFGLAPGVSLSTLDAIAACESGGDLGVCGRQRHPGSGVGGRAGLPGLAALQPRRLEPVAGLRPVARLQRGTPRADD